RRDGEYRFLMDTGAPRFDRDGRFAGFVGSCIDITDRRRAEDDVAEQREWFRVTLGSIADAVIATDLDARITFMNQAAGALTGWDPADALGRPLTEVFNIVNEHTRQRVESPVPRVLRDGTIVGLANHTVLIR